MIDNASKAMDLLEGSQIRISNAKENDKAVIYALLGIGHALLAVFDELQQERARKLNEAVVKQPHTPFGY